MTPPNLQRHALHGPPAGGWINRTHSFCTTRTPQGLFWCPSPPLNLSQFAIGSWRIAIISFFSIASNHILPKIKEIIPPTPNQSFSGRHTPREIQVAEYQQKSQNAFRKKPESVLRNSMSNRLLHFTLKFRYRHCSCVKPGNDTASFSCLQFQKGHPLYLDRFRRAGSAKEARYVAGERSGLTECRII